MNGGYTVEEAAAWASSERRSLMLLRATRARYLAADADERRRIAREHLFTNLTDLNRWIAVGKANVVTATRLHETLLGRRLARPPDISEAPPPKP